MPHVTSNLTRPRKIALNDLIMVYCNLLKPRNISQAYMIALCSDIIERWDGDGHTLTRFSYNKFIDIMTTQLAPYDITIGFGYNKGGQYSNVMFEAHVMLLNHTLLTIY